jgi:hypothetical protein
MVAIEKYGAYGLIAAKAVVDLNGFNGLLCGDLITEEPNTT